MKNLIILASMALITTTFGCGSMSPQYCMDISDPTECADSILGCHFDQTTRQCLTGKLREALSCQDLKDPDSCSKSPLDCLWSVAALKCLDNKTAIPTTCSEIQKPDICVNSALGCEWKTNKLGIEVCENAPLAMPVLQPIFDCASIINDQHACENSSLGCTWDMKSKLCVSAKIISAQSCFQINDPKICANFTATSCRWENFPVLKKSFCLPSYIPNDPQLEYQWHLLNTNWQHEYGINAIDAWSITHGDPKVIIGVVDSGFPLFYPDLGPKCTSRSFAINQNISMVQGPYRYKGFHGLSVAAAGMACSDNNIAGSGVDHKASLRVASLASTDKGQMQGGDINKGISWLANIAPYKNNPEAHIINLSLGALADLSQPFGYYGVIKESLKKKIIIVAASGNEAQNVVQFTKKFPKVSEPASIAGVISVGASNIKGNAGSFSNWGPFVDIMAPGVNIMVNVANNPTPKYQNGTSFASPIVSGVVGLMKAVYPDLTPSVAKHILRQTAKPLSCNQVCSAEYGVPKTALCKSDMCPAAHNNKLWRSLGLVDAYKAVQMAQKGMPQDPIIYSEINWIGIGVKELQVKDGKFFVSNTGPVDGEITLTPHQDPHLMLMPTQVLANKRALMKLSYTGKLSQQKSIIVYFDVHEPISKRYVDTFALVVVIK
jgi:subtilisin family serine protease